jgi:hypothetical protein
MRFAGRHLVKLGIAAALIGAGTLLGILTGGGVKEGSSGERPPAFCRKGPGRSTR